MGMPGKAQLVLDRAKCTLAGDQHGTHKRRLQHEDKEAEKTQTSADVKCGSVYRLTIVCT